MTEDRRVERDRRNAHPQLSLLAHPDVHQRGEHTGLMQAALTCCQSLRVPALGVNRRGK